MTDRKWVASSSRIPLVRTGMERWDDPKTIEVHLCRHPSVQYQGLRTKSSSVCISSIHPHQDNAKWVEHSLSQIALPLNTITCACQMRNILMFLWTDRTSYQLEFLVDPKLSVMMVQNRNRIFRFYCMAMFRLRSKNEAKEALGASSMEAMRNCYCFIGHNFAK